MDKATSTYSNTTSRSEDGTKPVILLNTVCISRQAQALPAKACHVIESRHAMKKVK
jgi:hypothetical protein